MEENTRARRRQLPLGAHVQGEAGATAMSAVRGSGKQLTMPKNKVLHSINQEGELRCVDVFLRPDGTFGFEEFRRDPEDGRGWFPVGFYAEQSFGSPTDALEAAKTRVSWLADAAGTRNG